MKVLFFGATGMVGQGVMRELCADPAVERVLAVGRTPSGVGDAKVEDLVHQDLYDYAAVADRLAGFDACLFCLGISAAGKSEADYTRVTYDLTMAAAKAVLAASPHATFIYVSGAGTDAAARSMWARVKGKTENDLLAMPFEKSFMFRPAFIQPMNGVVSKTGLYRAIYAVTGPLFPVWKAIAPKYVTTSEKVGRAMVRVAKEGADKRVLENDDINALAG